MAHPLVDQLRFARSEWLRCMAGVSEEEAAVHFGPMNCISWLMGHLAWHEQRYWRQYGQNLEPLYPELNDLYAFGAPMSTPSLAAMQQRWASVTADMPRFGRSVGQSVGSGMLRMTYHYWFHIGEIQAIRQMLGHTGLGSYVGDIEERAPYRPDPQAGD
jgi:hypothetical protein